MINISQLKHVGEDEACEIVERCQAQALVSGLKGEELDYFLATLIEETITQVEASRERRTKAGAHLRLVKQ
jgi:hypothetical protein